MSFPANDVIFIIIDRNQDIFFARNSKDTSEQRKKYEFNNYTDFTLTHTYCTKRGHFFNLHHHEYFNDYIYAKDIIPKEDIDIVNNKMKEILDLHEGKYDTSDISPNKLYFDFSPYGDQKISKLRAKGRIDENRHLSITYTIIKTKEDDENSPPMFKTKEEKLKDLESSVFDYSNSGWSERFSYKH